MLSKWPIRKKLQFGIGMLLVIVATLSVSGFLGVYAYRSLARSLRGRAEELPVAGELARGVSDLRVIIGEVRALRNVSMGFPLMPLDRDLAVSRFTTRLEEVQETLKYYRLQLEELAKDNPNASRINDSSAEWQTVHKIEGSLEKIVDASLDGQWPTSDSKLEVLNAELDRLQAFTWELPSYLHRRIHDFADEVRVQYRALIVLTWVTTILACAAVGIVPAAVLCLDLPAAQDSGGRFASRGGRRVRLSHPAGCPRRDWRTGRRDERHDRALRGHPRRSRPPGSRADQAGGAQRAIGQRRLSGRGRGP